MPYCEVYSEEFTAKGTVVSLSCVQFSTEESQRAWDAIKALPGRAQCPQ